MEFNTWERQFAQKCTKPSSVDFEAHVFDLARHTNLCRESGGDGRHGRHPKNLSVSAN